MPTFTEDFVSVAAWTFDPGGVNTKLTASTDEAFTGSTSGKIEVDKVNYWAAQRLDAIDGGVPTTTYWIAFAVFVPDWGPLWDSGTPEFNELPGFSWDDVNYLGFTPGLKATSAVTGVIEGSQSLLTSSVAVSAGVWNTVRWSMKLNGASSTEELWVNDVQIGTASGNPGASNGAYGVWIGNDINKTIGTFYVDALTWSPGVDPGEPQAGGGGGGGGSECNIVVTIDGVDVSDVAITGSATRRLNRPSQATITIPMWQAIGGPGSRLKISFDGGNTIFFHGFVLDVETDTAEDGGRTVYNATDPMELWQWRVVRDDTCDFSKPTIIEDYQTGPQIMEAALNNTVDCGTGPPIKSEGPIFLDMGTFAGGGVDLTGAPTDWPMTLAQLSSLLLSTGEVDLVITPTDPGGGVMGTIDGYNGDYGTDLSASVVFNYGMGDYSIRALRWNEDMSGMVNKLQYYLGPRVGTPEDPAGDQHWRANVQSFDPDFTPPGGAMVPPGGKSVDTTNTPIGPPWTNNQLGERIAASRFTAGPAGTGYGVRMDVRIYDARGDEATVGRQLYKRLWQIESWLRAVPRDLVHITPVRGYPLGTFDIGDIVGVNCVSTVRGGFSGAQRVYGYTISWSEDGPCELSELQTSADQEGF